MQEVKTIPHRHNIHAALHVAASQSPATCPRGEYLINYMPEKVHFQKDPLLTDRLIPLPTKPGFVIEIDASKVEEREVLKQV
ncbi:MAG: hypothetical protein M2R45_02866 [Verrucomicrobia subdivision 3 bacterium]|nr:hypothetical protein [Limisphaerales bacterium]MCS1414718.1 hypothetical protein [Limisphaerales bacterium]